MTENNDNIEIDKIDTNEKTDTPWNKDDDKILKEWVDKSACFKFLHEKAYKKYKKSYLRQMIPVIVISTLTGAANFALDRIPNESDKSYASLIVGTFNIIAAMISTVSQFLKTSELKEGHNISAKSWDKFNRSLKLELQRHPNERSNKRELFNFSMKEFDRLVEISPDIPTSVIEEFKHIYKDTIDLIKPEITGNIISSKIYEIEEKPETFVILENTQPDEENLKRTTYIEKFKSKYNRNPTFDEINEYLELATLSVV
jgi:hypothetical protein